MKRIPITTPDEDLETPPASRHWRAPVRRLFDERLIYEINRRVLHPLGYALAYTPAKTSHALTATVSLLETDDPEGWSMGPVSEDEAAGLARQEARRQRYLAAREAIGFPDGIEPLHAAQEPAS